MKYPKYLSIANILFIHIQMDAFHKPLVGGPRPDNLYYEYDSSRVFDLSRDLRTYEGLIEYGCTEPDKKELLRLLRV